jgi:hypothetical protein
MAMKKEIDLSLYSKIFFTLLIALLAVYLIFSMASFQGRTDEKQAQNIADVIRRAAVQCYALEGSYPPDVYYLKDHYGIVLDESRFIYFYQIYGSNIMPDIDVFIL